ncbi:alkaline phosphatase D family protein [Pokkaliibacter sp. CJK22405]|uniref:alkaline phosphatase D family protein n=1 Tax=Pokkaliibacter sp. CJK22405 TaxID=3384615 RepID=UPI003984A7D2
MTTNSSVSLPVLLSGPVIRRVSKDSLLIWIVTSQNVDWDLRLFQGINEDSDVWLTPDGEFSYFQMGHRCYLHLLSYTLAKPLPEGVPVSYSLSFLQGDTAIPVHEAIDDLCYEGESLPSFLWRDKLSPLFHGSCRKPHHPSGDGMVRADSALASKRADPSSWPTLMMMSGDQIYADDVAGPMLKAIHQTQDLLGLWHEKLEGSLVESSEDLLASAYCYYARQELLPESKDGEQVEQRFFKGVKKPIFTTDSAHNHLITLSEMIAMYLLVWSPTLWPLLELEEAPEGISEDHHKAYTEELATIKDFALGLPQVRRLLAHVPSLMIFDDHDVTDDWNLTAGWEQAAYGHPFSRRIIGNALVAYCLCQGAGNEHATLKPLLQSLRQMTEKAVAAGFYELDEQNKLIDQHLQWPNWGYIVPTTPPMVVLDTRTRRWRSEKNLNKPSGLLDWEALVDFQQALFDHKAVVVISAAPVFGVKLIEAVQRFFTWIGKPLLVDAENWMAHPGAANVMLNIFRHSRTPRHFVILSGDVHYSFVYDVHLRFKKQGPMIWQITSSGIKNEFPGKLLDIFDRLNRWLYAPWSPLNWFTKRRLMQIHPRRPEEGSRGERLINASGMGYVKLDDDGKPILISQLTSDGRDLNFSVFEGEEEQWE